MKGKFLSLNLKDFFKGSIVAVLTAVLTLAVEMLQTSSEIDYKKIGISAIVAFLSYLLKNWLTNSDDKFLKKEA